MTSAKNIQSITLDFSGIKSMQTVVAKQGDDKTRYIQINPISNGETLKLSNFESIDFRCIKPDGTSAIIPAVKNDDDTILVKLSKQILAVTGNVKADIAISEATGKTLSSSVFIIRVESAATNGNYIPSRSEEKRQADFDMDNHQIKNLSSPVNNGDAATKGYVDEKADEAIKNSKPMLITFNNSDFDNSDSQQFPIGIRFEASTSRIILMATFDVSRLNFTIPDGSDYSIHKVLVQGEPFDLSMLDNYIKSMESFTQDYDEGWIVEGSQYVYMHEYSFGTEDNANTVFAELSEMGLNGFQLLVNNYNKITAQEV